MSDALRQIAQDMTDAIRGKVENPASTQSGEIPLADLINVCCQERDPKGLDPKAPGAKLDHGKMKARLLQDFSRAIWAVGEVSTFGAHKYTEGGWQHADNGVNRYHDAFLRHWLKAGQEPLDPDSGMLHLAHAAWNLLATLELRLREIEQQKK